MDDIPRMGCLSMINWTTHPWATICYSGPGGKAPAIAWTYTAGSKLLAEAENQRLDNRSSIDGLARWSSHEGYLPILWFMVKTGGNYTLSEYKTSHNIPSHHFPAAQIEPNTGSKGKSESNLAMGV